MLDLGYNLLQGQDITRKCSWIIIILIDNVAYLHYLCFGVEEMKNVHVCNLLYHINLDMTSQLPNFVKGNKYISKNHHLTSDTFKSMVA
jgi:hypothetical protein